MVVQRLRYVFAACQRLHKLFEYTATSPPESQCSSDTTLGAIEGGTTCFSKRYCCNLCGLKEANSSGNLIKQTSKN